MNGSSKAPPPLTIRLTWEERARLEKAAGGLSLSAYVRNTLLGSNVKPRKTRGQSPVKDHKALAKALGYMGRLNVFSTLNGLAKVAEAEKLAIPPETHSMIRQACADIADMRHNMIAALGVKVE